jgi:hypothetical protein
LVTDASEENAKRFALEALVSAQEAEVSAQEAEADATIATNQAIIASAARLNAQNSANAAEASEDAAALSALEAASAALNTPLTGFATGANTTILATDTTLQAFGKTQGQISERIGGTVGAGQVAFGTGTKLLGGDNGLFWDNTNKRLGVGTNTPTVKLDITGNDTNKNTAQFGNISIQSFALNNNWYGENILYNGSFFYRSTGFASLVQFFNGQIILSNFISGTAGNAAPIFQSSFKSDSLGNVGIGGNINSAQTNFTGAFFRVFSTGNVTINQPSTDAGFRLDVNGTARVQGAVTLTSNIILPTVTGTRIGTATNQLLSFWNKTPIAQPTNAIAGATLAGSGGTTITSGNTFGGYTMQQIAQALINIGILT